MKHIITNKAAKTADVVVTVLEAVSYILLIPFKLLQSICKIVKIIAR